VTDSGSIIIPSFWETEPFSIWRQHRIRSRPGDQALGNATPWEQRGYGLDDGAPRICLFATAFRPNLGPTRSHIGSPFRGRKADLKSQVKHAWGYTFTPTYTFMAWCLIKHKDNFTFTFKVISITHSCNWALLDKPPIVQLLKNFPAFYGTPRFITVFRRALQVRGFLWSLVTSLFFLRWEVISPTPNSQAGGPPLAGCPWLVIQYIRSCPPYLEAISSIRHLRTRYAFTLLLKSLYICKSVSFLRIHSLRNDLALFIHCNNSLNVILNTRDHKQAIYVHYTKKAALEVGYGPLIMPRAREGIVWMTGYRFQRRVPGPLRYKDLSVFRAVT
jgi:hypothetical protein